MHKVELSLCARAAVACLAWQSLHQDSMDHEVWIKHLQGRGVSMSCGVGEE
jgi:hypothetical protein